MSDKSAVDTPSAQADSGSSAAPAPEVETTRQSSDAGDEKTFSQSDVDRLIGQRVNQASTKATREVLDALGFEDLEGAKKLRQDQLDAEKAQMSEAERMTQEAAAVKAAAEAAQAEARAEILRARISTALVSGDEAVNPQRVGLATDIALRQALESGLTGDDQITAAAAFVREQSPEWFINSGSAGPTANGSKTPPPPGRSSGEQKPPSGDDAAIAIKSKFEAWQSRRSKPITTK